MDINDIPAHITLREYAADRARPEKDGKALLARIGWHLKWREAQGEQKIAAWQKNLLGREGYDDE